MAPEKIAHWQLRCASLACVREPMKSATLLFLLPAIVLFSSACEKHNVSELAKIEEEHDEHGGSNEKEHEAPATHGQTAPEPGHDQGAESSPAPKFFTR